MSAVTSPPEGSGATVPPNPITRYEPSDLLNPEKAEQAARYLSQNPVTSLALTHILDQAVTQENLQALRPNMPLS